jgi:hypothetical protein
VLGVKRNVIVLPLCEQIGDLKHTGSRQVEDLKAREDDETQTLHYANSLDVLKGGKYVIQVIR